MIPSSTYRLQLDPAQVDLDAAAGLVPYLDALGASHLYASPVFAARPGSPHGYDVVDPRRVSPELGGAEALGRLSAELAGRGMGLLLDIVPNHMAIGRHNPWWQEVLTHGPSAPHARSFDLSWDDGKLLLPLLGRPYAEALEEGELQVSFEDGRLVVAYWDERFPVDPATYPVVLGGDAGALAAAGAVAAAEGDERVERGRRVEELLAADGSGDRLRRRLAALPVDRVHELLESQHYRPAWWQLSRERLGHRRFFTVTELVGLRQEDPVVFEETHALVRELVRDGTVDGLRVDHVDGLTDPAGYLRRLRQAMWPDGDGYLVVEKILVGDERLPEDWPVEGTTGYEYGDASGKLFLDPAGLEELLASYRRFTGSSVDFDQVVHDQKRFILLERLGPELARLAEMLERAAHEDRWARDVLPSQLLAALVEVVAALPVYRTYAREGALPSQDRVRVERALGKAAAAAPDLDPRAFDLLGRALLLDEGSTLRADLRRQRERFVERVQQVSGAAMAKGVEDTAFYQYNPLISLNEVGGDPGRLPGDPVGDYHAHNLWVRERLPATLTATSTHDSKRSEDVRARIGVLTQVAGAWAERVEGWSDRNRRYRGTDEAGLVPTRDEELFVYQTLVGSWPLDDADLEAYSERLVAHLVKAAREAKVHTAWLEPDPVHEEALTSFAASLVADRELGDELRAFAAPLWRAGAVDSLAQTALRLAAPGVPDVYRGTEMWDLSLTDPDNRRPVDWEVRRQALGELERRDGDPELLGELTDGWEDGRIKLFITWKGLRLRRQAPHLFREGDYLPVAVEGPRADHVVAFARRRGDEWAAVAVPRLTVSLTPAGRLWPAGGWEGTHLVMPEGAPGGWVSAYTGHSHDGGPAVAVGDLLSGLPVALLHSGVGPPGEG